MMKQAIELGREQVKWILAQRAGLAEAREAVVAKAVRKERIRKGVPSRAAGRALPKPGPAATSRGVLVAEGDSWFDYPFHDVLKELDDRHGWDVERVSHSGDTVESMAYSGGQLDDFIRAIQRVVRRGQRPRAILLSGGGNDVAGEWFGMLLNHRNSPAAGLNASVIDGVLEGRVRMAYGTILSRVTATCDELLGQRLPILTHGYDYPVPDGRGLLGGWGPLPGPWLEPGFRQKGFDNLSERIAIARQLIDRFYGMLQEVATTPSFAHVRVIDLRGVLSTQIANDRYKDWWGNELHPTPAGFSKVANLFQSQLA